MEKIISFSLFGSNNRYWHSIIPCLITYSEVYKGYKLRIYASKDTKNHLCYKMLKELSDINDNLQLINIEKDYVGTEPTIWRMMPLWDNTVETFFCRDVDSLPTSDEKIATEVFLQSRFAIHGIRSYCLHNTELMAGLCGFKSSVIRKILFCNSFEDYKKFGMKFSDLCKNNYEWGCDQQLLRKFFFSGIRSKYCSKLSLDSLVGDAQKVSWYKTNHIDIEEYKKIDVSNLNNIWEITNNACKFLAQPSHFDENILDKTLSLNTALSKSIGEILRNDNEIYKFYKER